MSLAEAMQVTYIVVKCSPEAPAHLWNFPSCKAKGIFGCMFPQFAPDSALILRLGRFLLWHSPAGEGDEEE